MVRSSAEVTKHGPSLDNHERSREKVSQWRTKVDPILRVPIPVMVSDLAPPTALFQDREYSVRSVIEADSELLGELATELRNHIYENFADLVFERICETPGQCREARSKDDKFLQIGVEAWLSTRSMQPRTGCGNQGRGDEQKIRGFFDTGWIVRSDSALVARGFLVPKPGTNKWRLLIDYRYLNPGAEGHEFPLPVTEDLLQGQLETISGPFWICKMASTRCPCWGSAGT